MRSGSFPSTARSFSHQAGEVADRVIKLPTFSISGCAIEFFRADVSDGWLVGKYLAIGLRSRLRIDRSSPDHDATRLFRYFWRWLGTSGDVDDRQRLWTGRRTV